MTRPPVVPVGFLVAIHFGLSGLCLQLLCRSVEEVPNSGGGTRFEASYNLESFLIYFVSLALLVYSLGGVTHHLGWLRWSSGDLHRRLRELGSWLRSRFRWLGRKLADPSQEP